MQQRLGIILGAVAVGVLFFFGLFEPGHLGGALLIATAAILAVLSATTWERVRPQGRPLRVIVVAVITAIAVVKLIRG